MGGYWVYVRDDVTRRLSLLRYVDNQLVERLEFPQPSLEYTTPRLNVADDYTLTLLLKNSTDSAVYRFSNTSPARLLNTSAIPCSAGVNRSCSLVAGNDGSWYQFNTDFVERYQPQGVDPDAAAVQVYRRPLNAQFVGTSSNQGQLLLQRSNQETARVQVLRADGGLQAEFPGAVTGLQARWLDAAFQPMTAPEPLEAVLTNPIQTQVRRLSNSEAIIVNHHQTGSVVMRVGSDGLRARSFVPGIALEFARHSEIGSYLYGFGDMTDSKKNFLYRYDYLQQRLTEEKICGENECGVVAAADIAGQSFVQIDGERVLQRVSPNAPYREIGLPLRNLDSLRAVTNAQGDVARFFGFNNSFDRGAVYGIDAQGEVRSRYEIPSTRFGDLALLSNGGAVALRGPLLRADPFGVLYEFPACDVTQGCSMSAALNGDVWRIVRNTRGTEVQRFSAQGAVSAPLFVASRSLNLSPSEDYLRGGCFNCDSEYLIRPSSAQTLSVFRGPEDSLGYSLLDGAFGVLYLTRLENSVANEPSISAMAFRPLPSEPVTLSDIFVDGFEVRN
jgi:hypothetical protein